MKLAWISFVQLEEYMDAAFIPKFNGTPYLMIKKFFTEIGQNMVNKYLRANIG